MLEGKIEGNKKQEISIVIKRESKSMKSPNRLLKIEV